MIAVGCFNVNSHEIVFSYLLWKRRVLLVLPEPPLIRSFVNLLSPLNERKRERRKSLFEPFKQCFTFHYQIGLRLFLLADPSV